MIEDEKLLTNCGINYQDVCDRMMGNEELVERFMLKFLEDQTIEQITLDYEKNDIKELEKSSHTLKGISGNLGMKDLFEACAHIVNHIRLQQLDDLKNDYEKLMQAYQETIEGIRQVFVNTQG